VVSTMASISSRSRQAASSNGISTEVASGDFAPVTSISPAQEMMSAERTWGAESNTLMLWTSARTA